MQNIRVLGQRFGLDQEHRKIALALIGSEKKFQLFGVFIGLSAAPWRADSKNVYMSIANIVLSWSKM